MGVVCFSGPAVQLSTTRFTQSNSIGILGSKIISFGCEIISLKIFVTFFNIIFLHHLKYTNRYAVIRNSKPKSNFLYPEKNYVLRIIHTAIFMKVFKKIFVFVFNFPLSDTKQKNIQEDSGEPRHAHITCQENIIDPICLPKREKTYQIGGK